MSPSSKSIVLGTPRSSNKALYISIGLGILAALANLLYASRVQGSRVDILRAKTKIAAGTKVDASLFSKISIYGDDLKETRALVVQQKDLESFSQIPLAETVEAGQVLFLPSFQFTGNRGIREAIRPDQRAIALAVKEEMNAVGYFVRPGDTVDVWVNLGATTENVIPGAVVRAVGDASVAASDNGGRDFHYRSVTVIVSAEGLGEILHKLSLGKNEVTLALAGSPRTP